MAAITFTVADPAAAASQWALRQYFAELDRRFADGFEQGDALAEAASMFVPPSGVFVLVEREGETVGCGGVCFVDDDTGEIKRMWVSDAARGAGLGKRLLAVLEERIAASGRTRVLLDTNRSLLVAIAMYRACGYRDTDRYNDNPYADFWFEKSLAAGE